MYIFLAMLGATDIALSTCSILPKMLNLFWFHLMISLKPVFYHKCGFFTHSRGIESGVPIVMALDRYVAICNPWNMPASSPKNSWLTLGLGWHSGLHTWRTMPGTNQISSQILPGFWSSPTLTVSTYNALLKPQLWRLTGSTDLPGLFVAFTILGFDIIFITLSYIQIFVTIFQLPQKEARLKAFNTCIALFVSSCKFSTSLASSLTHKLVLVFHHTFISFYLTFTCWSHLFSTQLSMEWRPNKSVTMC